MALYQVGDTLQLSSSNPPAPIPTHRPPRSSFFSRFDKNKNLYIGLGANCNACNVYGNATDNGSMYSKAYDGNMQNIHNYYQKSTPCTFNATGCAKYQFASIYKLTPPYTHVAAPGFVQYASGVRNTVGFDFHPSSGAL